MSLAEKSAATIIAEIATFEALFEKTVIRIGDLAEILAEEKLKGSEAKPDRVELFSELLHEAQQKKKDLRVKIEVRKDQIDRRVQLAGKGK